MKGSLKAGLIILFLLSFCFSAFAEENHIYNTYYPAITGLGGTGQAFYSGINGFLINPAALASEGVTEFTLYGTVEPGLLLSIFEGDGKKVEEFLLNSEHEYEGNASLGIRLGNMGIVYQIKGKALKSTLTSFSCSSLNRLTIGFGGTLFDFPLLPGELKIGGRLGFVRLLETNFTGEEKTEILDEGLETGLGIRTRLTDFIKVGASLNNVSFSSGKNQMRAAAGLAVKFPLPDLLLACDLEQNLENGDLLMRYGIEKRSLFDFLALRAGLVRAANYQEYSAGLGINLVTFHVDAALKTSDFEEFTGSVGAVFQF